MTNSQLTSDDELLRRMLANALDAPEFADRELEAALHTSADRSLGGDTIQRIVRRSQIGQPLLVRSAIGDATFGGQRLQASRSRAAVTLIASIAVLCLVVVLTPTGSKPRPGSRGDESVAQESRQRLLRRMVADLGRAVPARLTAKPRPEQKPLEPVMPGMTITTGDLERRRVALPNEGVLFVNANSEVTLAESGALKLARGEVFLEANPEAQESDGQQTIEVLGREVNGTAAGMSVRLIDGTALVSVTHGVATVVDAEASITAGKGIQLASSLAAAVGGTVVTPVTSTVSPESLEWMRDLMSAASGPLVAKSEYAGGALVTVDPNGQSSRLSLRKFHVDVHIEDGFARTTIDQTHFNHEWRRLEGTFHFPLPTDASLSRLAMYVNGKLMEGGMAERQHARNTFEQIVHKMQDPALLEWVDGSTFKMRVFPLEPRQEKRIVLSYSQRLSPEAGQMQYRFPAGHSMDVVREWSAHVRVHRGAGMEWSSSSHKFSATNDDAGDLLLDTSLSNALLNRDLVVRLAEPQTESATWSTAVTDGHRYQMLRLRPTLEDVVAADPRRHWVVLFEHAGDRTPLLARTQIEVLRTLMQHANPDDELSIVLAGSRPTKWHDVPVKCSKENIAAGIAHLESVHLVGALDLAAALKECAAVSGTALAAGPGANVASAMPVETQESQPAASAVPLKGVLVHLGSGMPALGERDAAKLAAIVPADVDYLGIGVGRRWNQSLMKQTASRTGGLSTQINPDEDIAWRTFELVGKFQKPRLVDVKVAAGETREGEAPAEPAPSAKNDDGAASGEVATNDGDATRGSAGASPSQGTHSHDAHYLAFADVICEGEELAAICRVPEAQALPTSVVVSGTLNGQPWQQTVAVTDGRSDASYLPRHWAKLEIDRLLAADANGNRDAIVALSKAMYVMSPFTSLLVLENEEMYTQYSIDRGRKDHWALYPCPDQIEVVTDQSEPAPAVVPPVDGPKTPAQILASVVRLPAATVAVPEPVVVGPSGEVWGLRNYWYEGAQSIDGEVEMRNRWGDQLNEAIDAKSLYNLNSNMLGRQNQLEMLQRGLWSDGLEGRRTHGWETHWSLPELYMDSSGAAADFGFAISDLDVAGRMWDFDQAQQPSVSFILPDGIPLGLEQREALLSIPRERFDLNGMKYYSPRVLVGADEEGLEQMGKHLFDMPSDSLALHRFITQEPAIVFESRQLVELSDRIEFETLGSDINRPELWRLTDELVRSDADDFIAPQFDRYFGESADERDELQVRVLATSVDEFALSELAEWDSRLTREAARESRLEELVKLQSVVEESKLGGITFSRFGRGGIERLKQRLKLIEATPAAARSTGHRWDAAQPGSANSIYVPITNDGPVWMPNTDPRRLCDLLSLAPGLNTSRADRLAVLDREWTKSSGNGTRESSESTGSGTRQSSESSGSGTRQSSESSGSGTRQSSESAGSGTRQSSESAGSGTRQSSESSGRETEVSRLPLRNGTIEDAARQLIENARSRGWESVTLPGRNRQPGLTILCDGRGRHVRERVVGEGLREVVVCDGETLWHVYREIGLASSRTFSRFHHADLMRAIPWLLPSADELAVGADVTLAGPGVVAVRPAAEDVVMHLVFDASGHLTARRYLEHGTKKLLMSIEFAQDGTVLWLNGDGAELSKLELKRSPAAEPSLKPELNGLVVLPMPVRTPEAVQAGMTVDDKPTPVQDGQIPDDQLSEADALALMLAFTANGNGSRVVEIARRRFIDKGDTRDGLYVLLSRFPQALVQAATPADPANPTTATPGFDLRPPVEGSRLKQFVRQSIDWLRDGTDSIPFVIAQPKDAANDAAPRGVLDHLVAARNLAVRWSSGQATTNRTAAQIDEELKSALSFIETCRQHATGWMLCSIVRSKLAESSHLKLWAEAVTRFENHPVLGPIAVRERIIALVTAGELTKARERFSSWLTGELSHGIVPVIGDTLYQQLVAQDGQAWMDDTLRAGARQLADDDRVTQLTMLAAQVRSYNNIAIADEVLSMALKSLDAARQPVTTLFAVEQLRKSDATRAIELMDELMTHESFESSSQLWRYAAQIAQDAGRQRLALARLERATQLDFATRPTVINMETVRADYAALLAKYDELLSAAATLEVAPMAELAPRIIQTADQWRALDDNDTAACQAASKLLAKLGLNDSAWDYLTTPLAENSGESGPWTELARATSGDGRIELADMAWSRAFEMESTNPDILLEHARMLRAASRVERARTLLRQVVNGSWQPRFSSTVEQAKAELATL